MSKFSYYNDTQMNFTRYSKGTLIFTGVADDGTRLEVQIDKPNIVRDFDVDTKEAFSFVDLLPDATKAGAASVEWDWEEK